MRRLVKVFISAIVAFLLLPSTASAQDVTEPSLKAALVFNFHGTKGLGQTLMAQFGERWDNVIT